MAPCARNRKCRPRSDLMRTRGRHHIPEAGPGGRVMAFSAPLAAHAAGFVNAMDRIAPGALHAISMEVVLRAPQRDPVSPTPTVLCTTTGREPVFPGEAAQRPPGGGAGRRARFSRASITSSLPPSRAQWTESSDCCAPPAGRMKGMGCRRDGDLARAIHGVVRLAHPH